LYKSGPAIDWGTIFIHTIYLFSKNWKVEQGSHKIIKRDGILMIYLTIDEVAVEDAINFQKLTRKEREVLIDLNNILAIDTDPFNTQINGFLKHENEELKADAEASQLLSDYVDLAIIWKIVEKETTIYGMHSVTSVQVKSISSLSKNEKSDPHLAKVSILAPQSISHNFTESSYFTQTVKLNIDLSNLHSETQTISIRTLEPYEMQGEDLNVYVNMESNAKIFNWIGKNEV
jgi:hypothetical protein